MTEIATVSPFEALGTNLRFGTTEDGTPFVVAADFARAMEYSRTSDAMGLLDDDEKGAADVRTLGGVQRMGVIYEDGIWELIFRSSKPEAKALKKRVKEILAALRRGELTPVAVPQQLSRRDLAEMIIAEADRADAAEARVAELEPKAAAVDALTDVGGALKIGAVANMWGIGRTNLFRVLYAEQILMRDKRPYQAYADWFRVVMTTHESAGREIVDYTAYLWPHGAARLHALLTKRGYNLDAMPNGRPLAVVNQAN